MTHIMIDLETMSTRSNAVILELGFCFFDPFGEGIEYSHTMHPDVEEQILAGRHMMYSTVRWWMRQDELARKKITNEAIVPRAIGDFLSDIDQAWGHIPIEGIWGHGANFDPPILADLFEQYQRKVPWKYNQVRDTRTVFMLWPTEMIKAEIKHSAEDDAIAQALTIQAALRRMPKLNID